MAVAAPSLSIGGGGDLEKISHKFEYKTPTPSCNGPMAEGNPVRKPRVLDPPIGPETETFFDLVEARLLALPRPPDPMKGRFFALCDFDGSGRCDAEDLEFFQNVIGTCRDDDGYHPAVDVNGDGCVSEADQKILLSNQ